MPLMQQTYTVTRVNEDGSTRVLAVTDQGILDSVDGGVTFAPLQ